MLFQINSICRWQNDATKELNFGLGRVENTEGKEQNAG